MSVSPTEKTLPVDHLAQATNLKVLLVDDSTELRERLVEMLSQVPGLDVMGQVDSVTDARSALRTLNPDLVILDLQMRDGTGIDVLRELRSTHPQTKVIIFTNHPEEQYRRRCTDLGVTQFLSKSTDSTLLIEFVEQLALNRTSSMDSIEQFARAAHDFNDLLTAIIGYTDLSLRRIGPDDSIRHNLEETKRAAERAAALLRRVRTVSRINSSSESRQV